MECDIYTSMYFCGECFDIECCLIFQVTHVDNSTITVTCTALSQNGGKQFLTANSAGELRSVSADNSSSTIPDN